MDGYQCSVCHKAFGRQEHLRRHEQSHKDPQFHCHQCSKPFHRKDALSKHEQTHRSNETSLLRRGARACSACASVKSRCTGNLPCARCSSRKLQCVYPASRGRSVTDDPISLQDKGGYVSCGSPDLPPTQPQIGQESYDFSAYQPETGNAQGGLVANTSSYIQSVSQPAHAAALVQQPFDYNQDTTFRAPVDEDATIPAPDWTANVMSTINWLQADTMSFNDDDLNNLYPLFPGDFSFSPSIGFVSPTHQGDIETPVNNQIANLLGQRSPPQSFNDAMGDQQAATIPDSTSAGKSTVASGEYYVDGNAGRLPRSKRRKIVSRPKRLGHVEEPDFSLEYRLPVAQCIESRLILSDEIYGKMCTLHLQLCLETTIFKTFLSPGFPPKSALEGLLSNYFTHFDQTMPFLHFPMFQAESTHGALLLAMMAIGSCFVEEDEAEIFTLSMHEFVRRYIIFRTEQRYWRPETPQTLAQVHLLHAIGAGYTLWGPLRASASSSLYEATKFCRDTWTQQRIENVPGASSESVSSKWTGWIKNEELTRTGFCIWLLDCMWAFQFHQPPHLMLDVATAMCLPCPDRMWSAKDVAEWTRSVIAGNTGTPTLLEALRNLYIDKRLLPNLGEFSRIILIHSLFHRTWEVRRTVTQSLSSLEPSTQKQASSDIQPKLPVWPPSVPLFNRWRNSACDCLDILHWSANSTIGLASGMEHPTVLHLHLARIILLAPMDDIILFSHYLIRSSKDSVRLLRPVSSAEAEEHRRVIQRWALQDQYKARLAAIHAGTVFWHVRLYAVNGFYEPTAVAFAALVLWALGAFSAKNLQSRKQGLTEGASSSEGSPPPDVCDIILIDRPTDDELVQQFVRQGDNMHANITGVGDLFGPKGPRKVLAEGQKLLVTLRSWRGITEHWLGVLNRLEKVTAMLGVDTDAAEVPALAE